MATTEQNHFLITDETWGNHVCPVVNGEQKKQGLVPRSYERHPVGSYRSVRSFDVPLIDRSEWPDRIRDMAAQGSFMRDIRRRGMNGKPIPSLDQDGIGYCWIHSGTAAVMMTRAKQGEPYKRLSAFMAGCIIKNYQDEGGWGAQGIDFIAEHGVPEVKFWPEKSMNRANDTPEMRANAMLHRTQGVWADMQAAEYDRNLSWDQSITSLLLGNCNVEDFNWWGHSVLIFGLALAAGGMLLGGIPDLRSLDMHNERDAKVMGDVINKVGLNSWTDNWGDLGEFTLTGNKAHSDGGVAVISALPSNN
jgi:hypothetical protein